VHEIGFTKGMLMPRCVARPLLLIGVLLISAMPEARAQGQRLTEVDGIFECRHGMELGA
jgi:hypothetical protein